MVGVVDFVCLLAGSVLWRCWYSFGDLVIVVWGCSVWFGLGGFVYWL